MRGVSSRSWCEATSPMSKTSSVVLYLRMAWSSQTKVVDFLAWVGCGSSLRDTPKQNLFAKMNQNCGLHGLELEHQKKTFWHFLTHCHANTPLLWFGLEPPLLHTVTRKSSCSWPRTRRKLWTKKLKKLTEEPFLAILGENVVVVLLLLVGR